MWLLFVPAALAIDVYEGEDLFAAIAALGPGDELVVHAGTYSTRSSGGSYYREVTLAGTEAAPIVVRAADGETVVIEGDSEGSQNTVDLSGTWYTWQGFEMVYGSHGLRIGTSAHGQILDNHIHDSADVGLSMNRSDNTYEAMTVSGNEIDHTHGTGECMYLGCNDGGCVVWDSVIQGNYCHDTADTEQGDGIELKSGSYNNAILDNVIINTNYPGITLYGTYGAAKNRVAGNLVWGTRDNGIQIVGDVDVENNLVVDAAAYGIYSKESQGATPEHVSIRHNTVVGGGDGCLRINDWDGVTDGVVANNLLICAGGTAVRLASGVGGAIWSGNLAVGDTDGASGVGDGGSADALVVDAAAPDLYPVAGGALVDAGNPDHGLEVDFDCQPRDAAPDVGAYEWTGEGGPLWAVQGDFKPGCGETTGGDDTGGEPGGDTGPQGSEGDGGDPGGGDGPTDDSAADTGGAGGADTGTPKGSTCGCAANPEASGWAVLLLLGVIPRRRPRQP